MLKSPRSHAVLDASSRQKKANKIIAVLREFKDLKKCRVLEVGTGSGVIAYEISKHAKQTIGVDVHDERLLKEGFTFRLVRNEKLPFPDNHFDVVISNHVIEHILNQEAHLSEMHRVLKESGIAYLATPNKFWLIEPHHNLPFLSWLPKTTSCFYLKLTKNKVWDINPLSYYRLVSLVKQKFHFINFTLEVIKHPDKFYLDELKFFQPLLKHIPEFMLKTANPFVPAYIFILKKTKRLR